MYLHERDFFIAKIKAGYTRLKYNGATFKYELNNDAIYASEEVFLDVYHQCEVSNVLTDEQAYELLLDKNLWDEKKEELLTKKMPDYIENTKVKMYESSNKPNEVERIRLYLNRVKEEIYRLYDVRHQFDYLTSMGAAIYARWNFLVKECVSNVDGSKIDWDEINPHDILKLITDSTIDENDIRYLARNEPWATIWSFSKTANPFNRNISDWTEDQKRLMHWSSMYDNIREHEKCPSEHVLNDNDCCDGWMVVVGREQKKNKGAEKIHRQVDKFGNAKEIFIPVKNEFSSDYIDDNGVISSTGFEAENIFSLNNPMANAIIGSRIKAVQEHGTMGLMDLPDVKLQLAMGQNG